MTKYGIDVSKWQASINWPTVKASGKVDFVIMKAGYGNVATQKDPRFEENYKGCKDNGIPCGCYWYSYAKSVSEAEREADACLKAISGKQFEYPVYIDFEEGKQFALGKATCSAMVKAFCNKLEAAGYFVGVYCSKSHFDSYMDNEVKTKYTIWVAHYGVNKTTYSGPYDIWQKSDKGKISGINGYVDLDECYRDFPSLIKSLGKNGYEKPKTAEEPHTEQEIDIAKSSEPVETPIEAIDPDGTNNKPINGDPPMPKMYREVKIICNSLYIRSGPSKIYPSLGVAYTDEVYLIEEEKDGFGKIKDRNAWICMNLAYVKEIN